jgi:hypothetical protein
MTNLTSEHMPDTYLLRNVQALRDEVIMLRDDVALMRGEIGALAMGRDGHDLETLRRLWAEGLASGIAGELDEVIEEVIRTIPGQKSEP